MQSQELFTPRQFWEKPQLFCCRSVNHVHKNSQSYLWNQRFLNPGPGGGFRGNDSEVVDVVHVCEQINRKQQWVLVWLNKPTSFSAQTFLFSPFWMQLYLFHTICTSRWKRRYNDHPILKDKFRVKPSSFSVHMHNSHLILQLTPAKKVCPHSTYKIIWVKL